MLIPITDLEFARVRREKLLSHAQYSWTFADCEGAFRLVTISLARPHVDATLFNLVEATQERAQCSFKYLANCFSGGHSIADLHTFFPTALSYWEAYAVAKRSYHASKIGGSDVAHVALAGNDFYRLSGLICFAILLGYKHDVARLLPLVDYNNPQKTGCSSG